MCRLTYVLISRQDLSNIATRVFVQLLIISKYYDGDIDRAENGELMRLLEETTLALKKGSVNGRLVKRRVRLKRKHTQNDFYHL